MPGLCWPISLGTPTVTEDRQGLIGSWLKGPGTPDTAMGTNSPGESPAVEILKRLISAKVVPGSTDRHVVSNEELGQEKSPYLSRTYNGVFFVWPVGSWSQPVPSCCWDGRWTTGMDSIEPFGQRKHPDGFNRETTTDPGGGGGGGGG